MLKVSVIIPNYNRASLIGETIQNMLDQTLKPYELIVVDDGSTDESIDVIKSFGEKVTLLQQANSGPAIARNLGLNQATGEFVQFMDSDDLYSLNKLEEQAAVLDKTNSDIVFSPWVKLHLNEKKAILENHVLQNRMPSHALPLLNWYLRDWSTVFQTFMIRRSFLKKVGKYKEDLMPTEDIELFVRILLNKPKVSFSDKCLTLYRLHDMAKISGDGVSLDKKLIDRGKYLKYTCENLIHAEYKTDTCTDLIFKSEIWSLTEELKHIKDCPIQLSEFLGSRINSYEVPIIKLLRFYLRIHVFLRKKITGSYWRHYYQSSYPSKLQVKLIQELGYKL